MLQCLCYIVICLCYDSFILSEGFKPEHINKMSQSEQHQNQQGQQQNEEAQQGSAAASLTIAESAIE
jgi:hypothetical protein